jgi:hypothetical protein
MIRIVIENVLLFLAPTLCYVIYVYVMRSDEKGGVAVLDDAPLIWLFAAGAALVLTTLVLFGSTSGGRPGQTYHPPVIKDGRIQPGHID